jgi:hypothetical protein
MMQAKRSSGAIGFGWAAGLGAITIGVLLWLGLSAPPVGCGETASSPVMAFQAARSAMDLANIFGSGPSACRSIVVEGLATGSKADLFVFIPAYGAFLGCIIVALHERWAMITIFLIATLIATLSGDIAETTTQLQILKNIDAGPQFLSILVAGNGLKTIGLSSFLIGMTLVLWKQQQTTSRVVAALLALLATLRIAGFMIEDVHPLAPLSALGAFVAIWAYAGLQLFNSSRTKIAQK